VVSQFGRPRGVLGRLAGTVMAHRRSNVERSLWTVSLLDLEPSNRVLEIGFGPGLAIAEASRRVADGLVVGLDHSETMLRKAERRNRREIREGRVRLIHGSFENLSQENGPFDKIFAVNSIAFWPQPVENLKGLSKLLAQGGTVAITEQPRSQGANEATASHASQRITAQLLQAGFEGTRTEALALGSVPAVCVLGTWKGRD
jgi:ubiquinone/menaquinone biosynthesis C-methylase UbiE